MTALLTFGCFPLFFVFLRLFMKQCAVDINSAPESSGEAGTLVAPSDRARTRLIWAFALRPALSFLSTGIYLIVAYGASIWGGVLIASGALVYWAFARYIRSVSAGA